jgi:type IV pilus assembly protein PilE
MLNQARARGFSLIEVLLVLAIIGIISGIAIPSYLGQRRRARVIGDAISNAKVMSMLLEARKADNGVYGTAGTTYTWIAGTASDSTFLPGFSPSGNSKMNYSLTIVTSGLDFNLSVTDPSMGAGVMAYSTNSLGAELYRLK